MRSLPLPLFLLWLRLTGRRKRYESIDGLRKALARDRRSARAEPPVDVVEQLLVSETQVASHRCFRLRPPTGCRGPQVIYLHGGAHFAEITAHHWRLISWLVRQTGCVMHVPIFPLAPEHCYTKALGMVSLLYRDLLAHGSADELVLMGDSSGGGFALAVAQHLAASQVAQPRDLILLSPWLDLTASFPGVEEAVGDDPWLAVPGLREAGRWWAGDANPAAPQLSPINGEQRGLRKLSIFVGTREIFLHECRALARKCCQAGVEVVLHEGQDMIHVWPLLPIKEAAAARRTLSKIITGAAATHCRLPNEEVVSPT